MSQRYRSSGEADAGQLQIMTIHKSKGLQFDRVHLPALDKTGRIDHPPLLAWEEHATAEQSAELLLAPIRSPYDDHHPVYHYIQLREKERDRQERLRLLYVASTRARYQVHLYAALKRNREGELKQPAANTLLGLLWPGIGQRFVKSVEQNEGASHISGEISDPVQIRRRLNSEWRLPELP
ncbi:MAG: 3'-5' exonuclease, partial [Gammaproteobacteria bacterium]